MTSDQNPSLGLFRSLISAPKMALRLMFESTVSLISFMLELDSPSQFRKLQPEYGLALILILEPAKYLSLMGSITISPPPNVLNSTV